MNDWREEQRKLQRMAQILSLYDPEIVQACIKKVGALSAELKAMGSMIDKQVEDLAELAEADLEVSKRRIEDFIDKREQFLEDIHQFRRRAMKFMEEEQEAVKDLHRDHRTQTRIELNELDFVIAKERAKMRTNKTKLQLSILVYDGKYDSIGEAYAKCLVDSFPEASSPMFRLSNGKPPKMSDQSAFRTRLLKLYHPGYLPQHKDDENINDYVSRCPVAGEASLDVMDAAHIMPYSIDDVEAAQLFGIEGRDGYKLIWGSNNGMLLSWRVRNAFDKGAIVFVPIKKNEVEGTQLKMVLLDQSYARRRIISTCVINFEAMDGQLLRFKNDNLPSLRNLYLHALMTVLRRKRHNCPGWENDVEKVFTGTIWSSASEGKFRKGTILALALEVGDLLPSQVEKFMEKAVNESEIVDGAQDQVTEQDKNIAVIITGTWLSQEELYDLYGLSGEL